MRVVHSTVERPAEKKEKRVPLYKDEAALERGVQELIRENNERVRRKSAAEGK